MTPRFSLLPCMIRYPVTLLTAFTGGTGPLFRVVLLQAISGEQFQPFRNRPETKRASIVISTQRTSNSTVLQSGKTLFQIDRTVTYTGPPQVYRAYLS